MKAPAVNISVTKKQPVKKPDRSVAHESSPNPDEYSEKPDFSLLSLGGNSQYNGWWNDRLSSAPLPELKRHATSLVGRSVNNTVTGSNHESHTAPMAVPLDIVWNAPFASSQHPTQSVAVTNDINHFCRPCLEASILSPVAYEINDDQGFDWNARSLVPDKDLFVNGTFDWAAGTKSFDSDCLINRAEHPNSSHLTSAADRHFDLGIIDSVSDKGFFESSKFLEWVSVSRICESGTLKDSVCKSRESHPAGFTDQSIMMPNDNLFNFPFAINGRAELLQYY